MKSIMTQPSSFYDDELISLPGVVNSLFQNSFLSPSWRSAVTDQKQTTGPLNVYEDNTNYYVLGLFPGIDPGHFDINVKENVLTISGKYDFGDWPATASGTVDQNGKDAREKGSQFRTLLSEIPQGQIYRQLQLPAAFDTEKIEALYENGILKLVVPKSAGSQVKRIQVKPTNRMEGSRNDQPQLSGKSS